jgi:5-methylcytosine-specific restriction enzyme subunit McrC
MGNFTAVESNEVFCKGKLLLPLHIRHNAIEKQRFFTEHDEFLLDRPENRILKSALLSIRRLSSQRTLTSEAAKLLAHFDEVPLTRDPAGDFARVTHDRNTAHYRTALHWAKIILSAAGPIPTPGDLEIPALLFPMEKLFEAFVAREIKVALRNCPHLYLASQNAVHFLVHHGAERWFLLRPDLVIYDRRKGYSPLMVLDTKWKLLDKNDFRFNLSQSDFQQLLCYGLTTLKGKGQLALIYPKTPHFPPSPEVCTFPMEAARELTLTIEAYDLKSGAFGSDALRDKILRLEENSPGASENNQAAY